MDVIFFVDDLFLETKRIKKQINLKINRTVGRNFKVEN